MSNSNRWRIYDKDREPDSKLILKLPDPPSWRLPNQKNGSGRGRDRHRGETFQPTEDVIDTVNAALYLRRPLLITGKPGTGKSSLAYAVAYQLMLGEVLYWPITTRTTLKNGLYDYDAIGRLQDAKQLIRVGSEKDGDKKDDSNKALLDEQLENIGSYITLGPLGTALIPSKKPRVLLVDEIDKSDIDLPNDLLTVLEEGRFDIPELVRIKEKRPRVNVRTAYTDQPEDEKYEVHNGRVACEEFPFVILTSNGERAFPPAFLRRCLRLNMPEPNEEELKKIVKAHLKADIEARKERSLDEEGKKAVEDQYNQTVNRLINSFLNLRHEGDVSTDQLLNAIFMMTREYQIDEVKKEKLKKALMRPLTSNEDG